MSIPISGSVFFFTNVINGILMLSLTTDMILNISGSKISDNSLANNLRNYRSLTYESVRITKSISEL